MHLCDVRRVSVTLVQGMGGLQGTLRVLGLPVMDTDCSFQQPGFLALTD